jgi:hypothetical protein
MLYVLLALQAFHVLFLLLHDWIPLGSLNNVAAVRAANPAGKLLIGTLISTSFFLFGFAASVIHRSGPYPHWLIWYLLISYLFLFVGELEAWWSPTSAAPNPSAPRATKSCSPTRIPFSPPATQSPSTPFTSSCTVQRSQP